MLTRVLVVARWTAVEMVRERILYVILLFAAVLVGSSCVLTPLAPGAQRKVVADFGLACLSGLGVLVVLLSGAGLVKRDIERRTLEIVLCRPVSRLEYLAGKCLGLTGTLLVLVVAMTGVLALALEWTGFGWRATYLLAVGGAVLELFILAGIAVLFSTFTSPALAALFTLGLFTAGRLLTTVAGWTGPGSAFAPILDIVGWIVPSLRIFDVRGAVVHGVPVPMERILAGVAYACGYTLLCLYTASLIFRRRELR